MNSGAWYITAGMRACARLRTQWPDCFLPELAARPGRAAPPFSGGAA